MVKRVTFSSICLALTVICLYGSSVLPTGRLATLALSSVFCMAAIHQYGPRYGAAVFVGSSILALLLIPNRMFTMLYILFIGHYPLIKLFIERLDRLWLEWVLKFMYFNLVLAVIYVLFKTFMMPTFNPTLVALIVKYMIPVVLGLEIIFAMYDWVLSYMIGYYEKFLRRISHD